MSLFEKVKKTSERWNCFSKSDVLGSFDFMTLTISLGSLNIDDFNKLGTLLLEGNYKEDILNQELKYELYVILKNFYGLSFHEYTHFIDSTSTIWGLNYLSSLNEAYLTNHDKFGTPESEYHKAKSFFDLVRSFKLPDYYTAKTPGVDPSTPWSYQLTSGRRFDSKGNITDIPISFISFGNSKKERIVRSPLSVIAILEVSAMAQEFLYKSFLVNALPEDIRMVENAIHQKESLGFIYNHNLTEYTACAHLVANTHNLKDILQAYLVCERISTVVLNFTNTHFDKIKFSVEAEKSLYIDKNSALKEVTENAIKHKDRGYVFYLICLLMPKSTYESSAEIVDGISSALKNMGLDYYRVIMDARREIETLAKDLSNSPIESLAKLAPSILKNFDQKVGTQGGMYNFSLFDLPPVVLGDDEIVSASPGVDNGLKDYDIEESYDELVDGQIWVERFSEACT